MTRTAPARSGKLMSLRVAAYVGAGLDAGLATLAGEPARGLLRVLPAEDRALRTGGQVEAPHVVDRAAGRGAVGDDEGRTADDARVPLAALGRTGADRSRARASPVAKPDRLV